MKKKSIILLTAIILAGFYSSGQNKTIIANKEKIQIIAGEKWWGGAVTDGYKMPFKNNYSYNMYGSLRGNQAQPLLISNKGRVIWSEYPFKFSFKNDSLLIVETSDTVYLTKEQNSLQDAFKYASKNYFPPNGKTPDMLLFEQPQYNTWMELGYNQNQKDILKYAHDVIDNGFPPGVIMIDDNWQEAYGTWTFHQGRFPSPKGMMEELHNLGFKVMLWVCPFVSPDTKVFREAAIDKIFLEYPRSQPIVGYPGSNIRYIGMFGWWNGKSALLDLSNPKAQVWFKSQLNYLIDEYDVDGFKFDAGDASFYQDWIISYEKNLIPNDHSEYFSKIGLDFPLNEYRATWKMGGMPLAQRLRDKSHHWSDLQTLIPNITVQGLMGYAFTCPDLIGGGGYDPKLSSNSSNSSEYIDQELIVRSAQVHALMPMMQFSLAPWRTLDKKHLAAVKNAVELRKQLTPAILKLVKEAAVTGEPIVRTMEYVFPNSGYEHITDQFLLGNKILVAPVLNKGEVKRSVLLPAGFWKGYDGKKYKGGKEIIIPVDLNSIPFFKQLDK